MQIAVGIRINLGKLFFLQSLFRHVKGLIEMYKIIFLPVILRYSCMYNAQEAPYIHVGIPFILCD